MLEVFTKTLISFIDKNLSALLLGAAGMLLLLIQYFKIPERWNDHTKRLEYGNKKILDRLEKIEDRQQRIFDFFKYSSGRVGNKLSTVSFDYDSSEFNNKDEQDEQNE